MPENRLATAQRELTAVDRLKQFLHEASDSKQLFKPDMQPKQEWKLSEGQSWMAGKELAATRAESSISDIIRVANEDVVHDIQLRNLNRYSKAYDKISGVSPDEGQDMALKAILLNSEYHLALEKVETVIGDNRPKLSAELGLVNTVERTLDIKMEGIRAERYADEVDSAMVRLMVKDALLLAKYLAIYDLHPPHLLEKGQGVITGGPLSILEAHARGRWEVWKKGYGLLCDVNRVLYVFYKAQPAD
jgi:hypothetical protein